MPASLPFRSVLSLACIGLLGAPASAQLQWQSTGVQQASHQTASPRTAPRRNSAQFQKPLAPRPKAPTTVAPSTAAAKPAARTTAAQAAPQRRGGSYAAERAVHSERVAAQATAILYDANRQAAVTGQGDVMQVCHDGGCGPMMEASCGVVDCGDPSCAFGCGEVGCGMECECGDGCDGSCGVRSLGGCDQRGAVPLVLFVPPVKELTLSLGVQAFKGPLDANRDRGNFGFNESINVGGPMSWLPWRSVGYQLGYRATHSQLHGSDIGDTADSHTQQFVTAGLYRRKPIGLQYGLVYDFLQDERIDTAEFGQVRGLISVTNPQLVEWGFTFASGVSDDTVSNSLLYEPVDQYLLFVRKKNRCGGELRFFAGVNDGDKGIVGGDIDLPLGDRCSLQTGFAYLIPEDDTRGIGAEQEQWNLGMNLVWHYGKRAKQSYRSMFRPLFNVADNGSFFVDSAN